MPGWEQGDWRDEDLCKFEESNLRNKMGLQFYDLSHSWGLGGSCASDTRAGCVSEVVKLKMLTRIHE
jgi:hypothetical protein